MQAPTPISDTFAKDAIIAWFRGEFAAANAIIDSLCNHLVLVDGGKSEYESVFSAIHRRRLNWIPILQMQKYYSIADVAVELRRVAEKKIVNRGEGMGEVTQKYEESKLCADEKENRVEEELTETNATGGSEVVDQNSTRDYLPDCEINNGGKYILFLNALLFMFYFLFFSSQ